MRISQIVPIVIAVAALAACIVVFFVLPSRREKTFKFLRSLKSEYKKISWYTWKQTIKGSAVVVGVAVILAIVIGLLDYGFSEGLVALTDLF